MGGASVTVAALSALAASDAGLASRRVHATNPNEKRSDEKNDQKNDQKNEESASERPAERWIGARIGIISQQAKQFLRLVEALFACLLRPIYLSISPANSRDSVRLIRCEKHRLERVTHG